MAVKIISIATKTPSGCPEELPRFSTKPSKRPQAVSNCVKMPSPCQVLVKSLPDSKICQRYLPTMVNHNGLLERPCLSTNGGLAGVRPRRASSIIAESFKYAKPVVLRPPTPKSRPRGPRDDADMEEKQVKGPGARGAGTIHQHRSLGGRGGPNY